MDENRIFVKEKKLAKDNSEELKKMIRVVPSMFHLVLIGGILIFIATAIWGFCGWVTTSVSAVGLYHPGVHADGEVLCFMPIGKGKTITEGMDATIYLSGYDQQEYGHMNGKVTYVEPYVTSVDEMQDLLGDDLLVNAFIQNGPAMLVVCKLENNSDYANGYYWSNSRGGNITVNDGMWASVSIVTGKMRPVSVIYPHYGE